VEEKQKFQSEGKLLALKVHAVWEKVENVLFFPFFWVADKVSMTDVFREKATPKLRVVKPT